MLLVIYSTLHILWFLMIPIFVLSAIRAVVQLIHRNRSSIRRRMWISFSLVSILYILLIPSFGNSAYVRASEMQWDLNHFLKAGVAANTPNALSSYSAEKEIIHDHHPLDYKVLQVVQSDPDLFDAIVEIGGQRYDITFVDTIDQNFIANMFLGPNAWTPFRQWKIVNINGA